MIMFDGEEALVPPIVGRPTIAYSCHMKNNVIVEKQQQENDIESALIAGKSEINIRDITKYFNYPNKENVSDYGVNRLWKIEDSSETMGSNFSRHHSKGLTGRRTQSSGNLCDLQGGVNDVNKISIPCSSKPEQRHNITGSLPNSLDNDKQSHDMDDLLDNNNVISNTLDGNLGGILSYAKSSEVEFHNKSTIGTELVKYHSHESLKGDPWKHQQQNSEGDTVRYPHGYLKSQFHSQIVQHEDVVSLKNGNNYHHGDMEKSAIAQDSKTLPIRRIDPKWCDPTSIRAIHKKVSMDTVNGHHSNSGLVMNRQRELFANANSKHLIVGENYNQDQGYASERSPEDELPPLLSRQSILNVEPPESTFRITLQKSSRGLGLSISGGGTIGPVRVKRLFPQQPAALSNQLKPGDILLSANGVPLSGLTNYEALEVLRTTSSAVELLVCRQAGETSITPPGDPPTPPTRRKVPAEPPRALNPIPPLHIEPGGEFDIEMTKVSGSLGFTLRKVDSSVLGHYVRALVREPALSDGRIQPGDKIVAVDDALLSPMTHEEAVSLLRQCGPKVKLRLYRDLAQTPVSALSPTEPDHPLRPSHTSLRQEAVDMLCDLAVRKLSPTTSNGAGCQSSSGAPTTSPRRLRKPLSRTCTAENNKKDDDGSKSQMETSLPIHDEHDVIKRPRPKFLNLSLTSEKIETSKDVESNSNTQVHDAYITNTTATTTIASASTNIDSQIHNYDYQCPGINLLNSNTDDNNMLTEPTSMPPLPSSSNMNSDTALSYKNPLYQSAKHTSNRHENDEHVNHTRINQGASYSSDHDIPAKIPSGVENPVGMKGLLKWKGVMFVPNVDGDSKTQFQSPEYGLPSHDCEVFMVELTRGWNSRLGFSLQSRDNVTVISTVYPDSVAAKDGRLKQGDILIMVNDENVQNIPTSEIIDLLRRIRGFICITVARRKTQALDT